MTYNPDQHHRRSIRLKGYDYSQTGAYFVTICTHDRECLFGTVDDGIKLNNCGQIIAETWQGLVLQYDQIELDEWLVMPNHLHGIIVINNPVGARFIAPYDRAGHDDMAGHDETGVINQGVTTESANNLGVKKQGANHQGAINCAPTLGMMVRSFKARCTHAVNIVRNTPGMPLWQRNYYERIIRDDRECATIRQYIVDNPIRWNNINQPHP